jgi:hypothetical protein
LQSQGKFLEWVAAALFSRLTTQKNGIQHRSPLASAEAGTVSIHPWQAETAGHFEIEWRVKRVEAKSLDRTASSTRRNLNKKKFEGKFSGLPAGGYKAVTVQSRSPRP